MNRIQKLFAKTRAEGRGAFVAYITMGSPTLDESVKAADTLLTNGADILELGVPFSDPMADGAVIRAAAGRALQNGVNVAKILARVPEIRAKHPDSPLVMFSYYNLIFHYGLDKFAKEAAAAGIDALLVVDVPLEDREEILDAIRPHGLTLVPLVAPTTPPERIKQIAQGLEDSFVYTVTVNGITGARAELPPELEARLAEVKNAVGDVPVCAGFGISTHEQTKMITHVCDGFVVGSALVKVLDTSATPQEDLAKFASDLTGRPDARAGSKCSVG